MTLNDFIKNIQYSVSVQRAEKNEGRPCLLSTFYILFEQMWSSSPSLSIHSETTN